MVRALDSRRYHRLLDDWEDFLDSPLPERSRLANATQPIKAVADQRIARIHRRALKQGRAITDQSADAELHALRKTCKKLRYLLEFFQSLYPHKDIKRLVKTLKQLQDNLGEFQDLTVQIAALQCFAQDIQAQGDAGALTQDALAALVEQLTNRKHRARDEFSERFAGFADAAVRRRYERLFRAARQRGAG